MEKFNREDKVYLDIENTKEEKIKKAWCNQYLDQIDKNGWANIGYCVNGLDTVELWLENNYFKRNINNWEIDYSELDNGEFVTCRIRPKSLQGIEDNNGWVKIESKEDLPPTGTYWTVKINGEIKQSLRSSGFLNDNEYWLNNITHYKSILTPEPPIY